MKKILLLLSFPTFVLNAMGGDLFDIEKAENKYAKIADKLSNDYEKTSKAITLLQNINTALDANNSFENLKKIGDKIPDIDKSALDEVWIQDSPKNHAATTIKMTEVMLIKALEIKLHDGLCAKTESAIQEKIAQMVIKLQNDYNNAKNNQEYIKAVAFKYELGNNPKYFYNK
jgi:hypothetical protein